MFNPLVMPMAKIKFLIFTALMLAGGNWIYEGYLQNSYWMFYGGGGVLLTALAGLAYFTGLKRFPAVGIVTNTMIVSALGIAVLECGAVIKSSLEGNTEIPEMTYSYAAAKGSPEAYKRWWHYYLETVKNASREISKPDSNRIYPYIAIPNSSARFFDTQIVINRLGLRNREIEIEKKNTYRVVAIGESTTAGVTINATDLPWPSVLEGDLQKKMDIPIEVVNAGFFGYHLKHNIRRLREAILPLKPDMLISYHGHNGFKFLYKDLPEVAVKNPPIYVHRPSWLLARVEHALKVSRFKKTFYAPKSTSDTTLPEKDLLETEYAAYYKELIDICRKNNIELVLCTFNMSVNEDSPEDVISFYEQGHPLVRKKIRANKMHNEMLRQIAEEYKVTLIDTAPGLDGSYEKHFIDLVHFTQSGRDQLAATIFPAVKALIAEKFVNQ